MLTGLATDARIAARALVRTPRFSLGVVLVLALATGSSSALFAVVDSIVLRPLPFPDEQYLVRLRNVDERPAGRELFNVPGPEAELLRGAGVFRSLVAVESRNAILHDKGQGPEASGVKRRAYAWGRRSAGFAPPANRCLRCWPSSSPPSEPTR